MKRTILFLLLICLNTKTIYSMEQDNPNDINDINQNAIEIAPINNSGNLNNNNNQIQEPEESYLKFTKKLLKQALLSFAQTEVINQSAVIASLKQTLTKKQTLKSLLQALVQEGINTEALAKKFADQVNCDPKIIQKLIEKLNGKEDAKKSIFIKAVEKLSSESIDKLQKMVIGGAIASLSWAIGHGFCHGAMESVEPTTINYALPLAITSAILTYLLYNSEKTLSFLRTNLIKLISRFAIKFVNLDAINNSLIEFVGQTISEINPELVTSKQTATNLIENQNEENQEELENEKENQQNNVANSDINDNIDKSDAYYAFIKTLTEEQKELLVNCFNDKMSLEAIIRLGKINPKFLLRIDKFTESLDIDQIFMLTKLMPEKN